MERLTVLSSFLTPFVLCVMERADVGGAHRPRGQNDARLLLFPGYRMLAPFLTDAACRTLVDDLSTTWAFDPADGGAYTRIIGCSGQFVTVAETRVWLAGSAPRIAGDLADAWTAAVVAGAHAVRGASKTCRYRASLFGEHLLPADLIAQSVFDDRLDAKEVYSGGCREVLKEVRKAHGVPAEFRRALAARGIVLL